MGRSGYDITELTNFDEAIDTPASICTEATEDLEETHPTYTVRTQFLHVVMAAHKRAAHDLNEISPDWAGGGPSLTGSLEGEWPDLSEQMTVFYDFFTGKGPELLLEFFESTGTVTWNLPQGTCDAEPSTPAASQSQDSGVALQDTPGKPPTSQLQEQEDSPNNGHPIVAALIAEIPRDGQPTKGVPQVPPDTKETEGYPSLPPKSNQVSQGLDGPDWSGGLAFSPGADVDSMLHDDILSRLFDPSTDGFASTSDILSSFEFNILWEK
ncbi:hypothetical protein PG994_006042 [Apiospora phragmitis]|uniref:Uncharacterized protein n=1 Tax=Apiospora phragmitis TaxID=2905665 RepID=A0ABR1VGJ0_9PEZI